MLKRMYSLLVTVLLVACQGTSSDHLLGKDFRLFQGTPVWELAKATRDEDVEEMRSVVTKEKNNIDYQEPKFGNTLLMLAVLNRKYKSCQTLLDLGADPNIHDTYGGSSAVIEAAGIEDDNAKFLKLLLSRGGDPNDEETEERPVGNNTRRTPLLEACSDIRKSGLTMEKVVLLVEAGANVNHRNEFDSTPLKEAVVFGHYDVVLYLINRGADFRSVLSKAEGKEYYLWDELRFSLFPLDSKSYGQKMEVVNFLLKNGIDYRKVPIPKYAVRRAKKLYPETWKEYLEKY